MTPTLSITDGDHLPEPLSDKTGFGIVDFITMPHWGSKEFENRKLEQAQQSYMEKWKIIFLNNFEYIEVKDEWYRVVDVRTEI
jgi:hypothetical protein